MMVINKRADESELQFIWRLCSAKDAGTLDLTWEQLATIFNNTLRSDDEEWTESAYRKKYQQGKVFYEEVFSKMIDGQYDYELQEQIQELKKEQIKTRDERNELRRIEREISRKESYKDQVLRAIKEHCPSPLFYDQDKKFTGILKSDNDIIISLTDIHGGIEIDNFFNKYDEAVLRDRFNQYLDKIFEVQLRHGCENAYVILSELVSGIIHTELRIENNQNLIEQFLMVINYIAEFLEQLSYHFNQVYVYVAPGNHSRISPKKEDSLKGENIDHFALPFLEAKLQNFENIHCQYNKIEESIAMFTVRGNTIMASHGDKDHPSSVVQKFTLMFGICPSIVYLGHRHTNGMSTVYRTKVIESGCLSGADNFALDSRLYSKPSQTLSIITEKGLDCLYNVEF